MVNPIEEMGQPYPRRAIILGASNVARGLSTIVQTSRCACGGPLEILVAMGRGRSYGIQSSLLGRKISGILSCGLWQDLADRPNSNSVALVTDIGNDLLYEVSVLQILDWLRSCLDRLQAAGCRTVMTELPIESARSVSPWQFRIVRAVLVPSCQVSYETILERCEELNEALRQLAAEREIALIPQKKAWFGFDPIHIKRRHWASAWQEILASWCDDPRLLKPSRNSVREAFYLHSRVPEERRVWGFTQRRAQPSGRLSDGTTIALY